MTAPVQPVLPPVVPTPPVTPPAPPVADPPAPTAPPVDKGYPDNTPVAEMTYQQQAAYYKAQSRKQEERVKAYGGLTTEQIADLRDKAEKHDKLERELMSDSAKAVAEAKDAAKKEADAKYAPLLVQAKFEAAAAGRIEAERLTTILEPLDMSKFLTATGEVDAAKVSAFVEQVAPGKGNGTKPLGPSTHGQGQRNGVQMSAKEQGRAEAEKRFGKPNPAA